MRIAGPALDEPIWVAIVLAGAICVVMSGCFGSSSAPSNPNANDAGVVNGDASASDAAAGVDATAGDGATTEGSAHAEASGTTGPDATATEGGAAPGPGACVPTGSMATARSYFYTGALGSGKVLVAGGGDQSTNAFATAELYDPATGAFSATGPMSTPRVPALPNSMVALQDGRMLVAGGKDDNCTALSSAELYDPGAGTWSLTGSMAYERDNAMAVALANGQVLVSGGYAASAIECSGVTSAAQASAELYDPSNGTFAIAGSPLSPRAAGAITLMSNGSALLVDGEDFGNSPYNGTAEVYDPTSDGGTFSAAGTPPGPAGYAFAYALPSGRILVKTLDTGGVVSLYDPSSNTFTTEPIDPAAAGITCGVALSSGDVFVAGGAQAEVYQASTGSWQSLGSMVVSRTVCGAAELPNGNVLVVGGTDTSGASVTSAEVCNPHPAANDGG
jgi:hypothetical protein